MLVSSDIGLGTGGVLGLKNQIADAKARGVEPACKGGFAYMRGPDNTMEYLATTWLSAFQPRAHVPEELPARSSASAAIHRRWWLAAWRGRP